MLHSKFYCLSITMRMKLQAMGQLHQRLIPILITIIVASLILVRCIFIFVNGFEHQRTTLSKYYHNIMFSTCLRFSCRLLIQFHSMKRKFCNHISVYYYWLSLWILNERFWDDSEHKSKHVKIQGFVLYPFSLKFRDNMLSNTIIR